MLFKTKFDIGQSVFWLGRELKGDNLFYFPTGPMTIGKVTIEHTDSVGSGNSDEMFDNYRPQQCYEEKYMMEQTGIGCGSVYPVDELFLTWDEAQAAAIQRNGSIEHE